MLDDTDATLWGQRCVVDLARIEPGWRGVYHQLRDPSSGEVYFVKEVARGVRAITGVGGRGMALAPAIAEESFQ